MDESPANQPERYRELVKVHGRLDPLVNINMKPDTHVKVEVLQMSLDLLLCLIFSVLSFCLLLSLGI